MSDKAHFESELKPGIFLSPGYYMAFWHDVVLKQFSHEVVVSHVKFKPYREAWVGAIMAAAQTMATGSKYYVGPPKGEPSDVDIVRLEDIKMKKSGRIGTGISRLNIQIIRCDLLTENILDQVLKKNKPAYEGMIVAVYVYGREDESDFDSIFEALKKEKKIYPESIVAVEQVEVADGIKQMEGTYGITGLYPAIGATLVNRKDSDAFFFEPPVFRPTPGKVGTEWEELGTFKLLPPKL
jgi:hypothetical protein